jgi:hypothetical protein
MARFAAKGGESMCWRLAPLLHRWEVKILDGEWILVALLTPSPDSNPGTWDELEVSSFSDAGMPAARSA